MTWHYTQMREILFRGKIVDDGRTVYGAALPHDGDLRTISCTIFRQNPGDGSLEGFEVYPESVQEYTGFRDKNGNHIFEGDKVEFTCPAFPTNPLTGTVVFQNGAFFIQAGEARYSRWQDYTCEVVPDPDLKVKR